MKPGGNQPAIKVLKYLLGLAVILFLLNVLLYAFQFDNSITREDVFYTELIAKENNLVKPAAFETFDDEVNFIRQIWRAVTETAPGYKQLPFNHERNVKDYYEYKTGLCFDRSYVLEKVLRHYGFQVRHVSIYYPHPNQPKWFALFQKSDSHAALEVKTQKGWMLLDSLYPILGIDENNNALSSTAFRDWVQAGKAPKEVQANLLYNKYYIVVYGLYSRHGTMFPPYNFIPDYNYRQLWYNIGI